MIAKFRSWWRKIRKPLLIVGITSLLVAVVVLIFLAVWFYGTGFAGKTLWDWLNLLGVIAIPVVVALGASWYTAQQEKVSDKENTDNQREAALQAYIDSMSELVLHEKLRESGENDEVRNIARVRTLTVLPRLDLGRKRIVLQFLYESGLIDKDKKIVDLQGVNLHKTHLSYIQLRRADLSGVNLSDSFLLNIGLVEAKLDGAMLSNCNLYAANLMGTDLRASLLCGSNLIEADLTDADLRSANLMDADLRGANLSNANLSGAFLTGAKVTDEQLDKAYSLKGATMPDESIHA